MANYLRKNFNKNDDLYTTFELESVKDITINYKEEVVSSFIFLDELKKLKNLESLTLNDGFIFNMNIDLFNTLTNLKEITFERCNFEDPTYLNNLKAPSLNLINNRIDNYNFIEHMPDKIKLSIINITIRTSILYTISRNLIILDISYSRIIRNESLNLSHINILYIDNSNIIDLEFTKYMKNLKVLRIDNKQYDKNKEIIKKLKKKNIKIIDENNEEYV